MKTNLDVNEIISRLNAVTEKFHTNSNPDFKFEGVINDADFKLFPTFDYGPRNQLRPQINGIILNQENYRLINLDFKLPKNMGILLFLTLLLNTVFMLFLFFKPIDHFISWKILGIFIPLTVLLFYANFNSKVEASAKVLRAVLNAETAT